MAVKDAPGEQQKFKWGVSRGLSQEKSTAQGSTVQYFNLCTRELVHSRNTVRRMTNRIIFTGLGGVQASAKHPNIPWVYQTISSSLMFIIHTYSYFKASNKHVFLKSLVKMVLKVPSVLLLYICEEKKVNNVFWVYCCLWLAGTIELQYRGIARKGQRTLVQNLPLFCSVKLSQSISCFP